MVVEKLVDDGAVQLFGWNDVQGAPPPFIHKTCTCVCSGSPPSPLESKGRVFLHHRALKRLKNSEGNEC